MRAFTLRHSGTSVTPTASGLLGSGSTRMLSPEMHPSKVKLLRKRTSVISMPHPAPALPSLTDPMPKSGVPSFSKSCHPRFLSPTPSPYAITITPADSPKPQVTSPSHKDLRRAPSLKKSPGAHVLDTVRALEQAARLPKPSDSLLLAAKVLLPPARKPQTIVFDLEETLAHLCEHKASAEVLVNSGAVGFNIRPYALQCLLTLRKQWEIIVFSSSSKEKADAVLDFLDPGKTVIDHRLYREQALKLQDVLVKDLRLLPGRDLRRTVIVDNTASAFAFQLDNGIPIKTWRNSTQDKELLRLLDFTDELIREPDMRVRLRRTFDLAHLREDFAKAFPLS